MNKNVNQRKIQANIS